MAIPLLAAVVSVAGCGSDASSDGTAPPEAGEWRTWIISSGAEIPVPPPEAPDGSEGAQVLRALGAGTPGEASALVGGEAVEPWMRRAMRFVGLRPKDPPYSSRAYALVAAGMHDAAVSAAYWQAEHGESYPSGEAAVAGAASRVLAHLFPEQGAERLDREAEAAARSAVGIDGVSSADAAAGLVLGRAVAGRAVARAERDGANRRWDGSRPPHTAAYWDPPPGSAARPTQPLAGTWRTWLMRSGDQFRAPPPPRFGSARFERAMRRVVSAGRRLTPEQRRAAVFWAGGEGTPLPAGIWEGVVMEYLRDRGMSLPEYTRVLALVSVAMADAGVAAWDTKYAYWNPRPENAIRESGIAPGWKPLLPTPFFPAYVSGHAAYSGAAATVLSHLFPDDARTWEARAREAARARVWGGIHWPYDGREGLLLGRKVGELAVRWGREDGAE